MAKKASKATSVNVALLTAIANAPQYVSKDDGLGLYQAGFITVDAANANPQGEALATITDAGKQYLTNLNQPENASKPMFGIMKNVAIPASKRGNRKGAGAPTQYPFETMEVGDTFFVPVSDKHLDPVKQLGSTVSAQNMKYSVETGETEQSERTKRGPGNKAVLDEQGNKVKEAFTKKLRRQERKFVIRSVKSGDKLGDWVAPSDGALIGREV